nr:hypothetical protein [Mycobacterium sp. E3298]
MKSEEIYRQLSGVSVYKVFKKEESTTPGFFFFSSMKNNESKLQKEIWMAVYNKKNKKYIVSNDIMVNGYYEKAEDLEFVGYADTLDWMMFGVYEHQMANNFTPTIQDEIHNKCQ